MITRVPNTPTPIGCLVGFFGLFTALFSILAFWGAFKAFGWTPPETEVGWQLVRWGAVAALPTLAGIAFCVYRITTAGKREYHLMDSHSAHEYSRVMCASAAPKSPNLCLDSGLIRPLPPSTICS